VKLLITGGSSFTGLWFCKALADAGHDVTATFRAAAAEAYDDPLRRGRVEQVLQGARGVFACKFGDDTFLELVRSEGYDALCCHGAQVADYRNPDFDFAAALASNTHRLATVLETAVTAGCRKVVLTSSVFAGGEGAGSEGLPSISTYGLSKALTTLAFDHLCRLHDVTLGRFVIPNPFGPWEEKRFTCYLVDRWYAGETVTVRTPAYVRDNLHVSLLARCYVKFVESLDTTHKRRHYGPCGYIESQGAFALRFAREMGPRLGLACGLEFAEQTDFSEPRIRINTHVPDAAALGWDESQAWDELADYYRKKTD
jgi:nucleoside-diphosphate-sugar epimerase